ncbi:hypothetical protein BFJ70_g17027 [Fusarium oxysporum]|nr:hypothetical protein BFJ70_g17027 [Fusarium oxysporum]
MAHEEACNAVSASGSNSALDYIERRLAFSRSLVRPDCQERQSKRLKQSVALPVQDELDQYLSEPPVDNIAYKLDPIAWWRDVGAVRFLRLSYMAVGFLTIASSSAETERDFSSYGRMVTPLRCRLRRHMGSSSEYLGEFRTALSSKGLGLITKQYRLAKKAMPTGKNPFPDPLGDCGEECSVSTELGIPCCHKISLQMSRTSRQVTAGGAAN